MSCANDSKVMLIDTPMDDAFGPGAGAHVPLHPAASTRVASSATTGTRRV